MNKKASEILIESRKKNGWSQTDMAAKLAAALGHSYSLRQYQKLEEGIYPKYKRGIIEELDKLLKTNLTGIIYEQNIHTENKPEEINKPISDLKDKIIANQEREIATLRDQIDMLKRELESNSRELVQIAQINLARIKTILECQKLLRSKALKEPMDVASGEVDKLYLQIFQDQFDGEN